MKVELLDHMGNDRSVVRAARVSYGKETKGPAADAALIDFLIRHGHTSPFAHVVFSFRLQVPIFVARQLMRHHVGWAWNEVSGRYTEMWELWIPPEHRVKGKANLHEVSIAYEKAQLYYERLLKRGVPREVARAVLPMGTMTTVISTANLRALFNMWEQRLAPDAQEETRYVAQKMFDLVSDTGAVPISLASWRFWKIEKDYHNYDAIEDHARNLMVLAGVPSEEVDYATLKLYSKIAGEVRQWKQRT